MDDPAGLCELHRLDDPDGLVEIEAALEGRGIPTDVWRAPGGRRSLRASRASRIMVRCRDLVYARWVAHSAGLDTWPDEPGADEGG